MNLRNETENKAGLNNKELSSNIDDKRGNEEKAGIMLDDEALEKAAGGLVESYRVDSCPPMVRPY